MIGPLQQTSTLDGRYQLGQRLGEGATGVVYRAVHLGLKKTFAVKLLKTVSPDSCSLARFRREAEALGQLRHPNVVEVTDFGIDAAAGGIPYLVMELLEGITLAELCREEGPLLLERALPILDALAAAIDAAHARGILHRDLKPGNILLGKTAEGAPVVKVVDFGLAELTDSCLEGESPAFEEDFSRPGEEGAFTGRLTATGALLGTPLYVAPELIRQSAATRASDLYSFGVIAYEVLTGHPPFKGSTPQVLAGHLERDPPSPAAAGVALSAEVGQTLQELLRKDPALRPGSALEVVGRLRRVAEQSALDRWRSAEGPRRIGLAAALAAIVLLAGLVLPWPALPFAERWMHDLRVWTAPTPLPDRRFLLLIVDQESLREDASLAERGDEFGATLARIFAAGARGVAIDFLLPAKWAHARHFSDLVLRHPEAVTLAALSRERDVIGPECVAGPVAVALGPERTSRLFGFVNLDVDADGVIRSGRLRYRDLSGGTRPSWAAKVAASFGTGDLPRSETANAFWIDSRIDGSLYAHIPWREVPAWLDSSPEVFQDRIVLVGGDFLDDYHFIPHRLGSPSEVSGLTLQALLAQTIVDGLPIRAPARVPVLAAVTSLTGLALVWLLCARRTRRACLSLAAAAVFYVVLSFPAFWWGGLLLPITSPLFLALLGLSLALGSRRWLPRAPEVSP